MKRNLNKQIFKKLIDIGCPLLICAYQAIIIQKCQLSTNRHTKISVVY